MDPLMTIWVFFIGCFIGILLGVILSYRTAVAPLQHKMSKLMSQKEQYHEIMKYYPYSPETFHFLGGPVDGLQFEDNAILFVRFKHDNLPLTKEQEKIKNLITNRKVQWFEFTTK